MRLLGSLALGAAVLAVTPVRAHDIANGQVIAYVWCSNCHRIDPTASGTAHDATPSFATIAGKNRQPPLPLATFLKTRHGGMPDLTLSRAEIDDVSAYILSLRGHGNE
jgi:mono/diheme cytochrome c family protein